MLLYDILILLMIMLLAILSVMDVRRGEIPNWCCYAIFLLGVVETFLDHENWLSHVIGLFAVSSLFYLIYKVSKEKAMGGGDVRLMAAAGLFLGWQEILLALVLACIVGAVIHLLLMLILKVGRKCIFGPYLSIGILIAMLYGKHMIQAYLGLFMQ